MRFCREFIGTFPSVANLKYYSITHDAEAHIERKKIHKLAHSKQQIPGLSLHIFIADFDGLLSCGLDHGAKLC